MSVVAHPGPPGGSPASARWHPVRKSARIMPGAAVLIAAILAWVLTGVSPGDAALFIGDEVLFALAPGMLLYAALVPGHRRGVTFVGLGYAAGSVLQVLAFCLTAALGARGLLWAYPPVVIVGSLLALRARSRRGTERAHPDVGGSAGRVAWPLAGVGVLAILYIALAYFVSEPLPAHAGSVVYIPDLVFDLGVAGEALHHWPIMDPKVVGISLQYETFVHVKLAAVAQTTDISLPTILFRLYILPLLLCMIGLLYAAGTAIAGRRAAGLGAAVLFVFVGALGLDSHGLLEFFNTVFYSFYDSPTYLLGLVFFVAALIMLWETLTAEAGTRQLGRWTLLTLLLVGCAGAKASILPVLVAGLALYILTRRLTTGLWERNAMVAFLLTLVVFVVTDRLIYGSGSGGLRLRAPGSVRLMTIVEYAQSHLSGVPHPLFWLVAAAVGILGFAGATLAGVAVALSSHQLRRAASTALLLALVIVGFVAFLLLDYKGGSQNFFTYYGICAGCILSAQGLVALWDAARPDRRALRTLVAWGAGWLVVALAVAIIPWATSATPSLGVVYGLGFLLPLAVAGGLWWASSRARQRRALLRLSAVGTIVIAGALSTPLQLVGNPIVHAALTGGRLYSTDAPSDRGLTAGLQRALAWVRTHTPVDAVLAVNNQFSDAARRAPTYYYYSAFAQRRVFLEGWVDTIPDAAYTNPSLTPFPRRLRLNDEVFDSADRAALGVLVRRYDVHYLFVDRVHGHASPGVAALGRRIYSNSAASVYRVN